MIISAAQLRAARGLLDWTRSELAKASGLSAETIKNIEHGVYAPQESTIAAIVNCFSDNNIEFTNDEGVRRKHYQVQVLRGHTGYKQFLDHIYAVMKENGGIIRQFNQSDGNCLPHAEDYAAFHLERMSKLRNIDAQVLTFCDDHAFPAPYCQYRWLDQSAEILMPYYVYNQFIEIPIHKDDQHIELITIHSPQLAARFIEQFEAHWRAATVPPKNGDN
ncbi:MAG: helix-turn-helix transcriptional regulator [Alphaproteobacteria bacterium]|nr:helix-turn-helix transcriptional regulator [Alphaproteobacteria bacterium]